METIAIYTLVNKPWVLIYYYDILKPQQIVLQPITIKFLNKDTNNEVHADVT